jgi:hypothetical protein
MVAVDIEGMRQASRRGGAKMISIERLWNALALGGVLFALLATAGVVNLGEFSYWPYLTMTSTSLAEAAEEPREVGRIAVAQPAPVEQQPQPALGTIGEVAEDRTQDATVQASTVSPASSDPFLPAPSKATTIPLHATLITPDGPSPTLRAHDEIKALLVTTTDAFVYCYYADGVGNISRIFPNRFQPDALVRSRALQLPDSTGTFALVADQPGRTEEVRCMAAISDVGSRLPSVLQAEDLVPLAVHSLNEISSMFHSLGEEVVETRLVAQVTP